MSLTSQDGSFPVQGSRPEWEVLYFMQVPYYSQFGFILFQFISEFLAPKPPLDTENRC